MGHDVVVVGAGVFGAWTAFHLQRSGARVLLIDQHGAANSRSSSGDETRLIRMSYGADEIYTRASMRSLQWWKQVCPHLFHETGVLMTAAPSDPYLIASRETLSRCGVKHEYLKHAGLRKQFPQIALDRGTAGIWEPKSGVLMARRAVQAVVQASKADYQIRAADSKIRAGTVVYACGPWLPKLFPEILRGRIRPTRQEVFFFGPPPEYKASRLGSPSARESIRCRLSTGVDLKSASTRTGRRSIRKPATATSRPPGFATLEPCCANASPPWPARLWSNPASASTKTLQAAIS